MKRTVTRAVSAAFLAAAALSMMSAAAPASPAPGIPLPASVPSDVTEAVEGLFALDEARVSAAREELAVQDAVRCEIDVCVDPGRAWISGTAALRFDVVGERAELFLDEALTILSLTDASGSEVPHSRVGQLVAVDVGEAGPAELVVAYEGLLHENSGSAPGLVVLLGEDCWYPCPRAGDRSSVRAIVRHPGDYAVVLSGALAGMASPPETRPGACSYGDVWEADAVERVSAVVGRIDSSWSILGDLFVGTHRFAGESDSPWDSSPVLRPIDLGMKEPLRFLESCFGPYPLGWLHIVAVPHGTIGAPAASGPGLIIVEAAPDDATCSRAGDPDLYLLELARSWWLHAHGAGPVLADGLAAHMEIQWLESVRGEGDASVKRAERREDYLRAITEAGGSAPLTSCLDPDGTCDRRVTLGRGGAMMGIASALLGPDVFCGLISGLAEQEDGVPPGLRAFASALTEAAGSSMDWFVYEWAVRGDLPVYALEYDVQSSRGAYLVRGTLRQLVEPFHTPVPLTVDLGGWVYDEWVSVGSAQQTFEFRTDLEPLAVTIDAADIVPRVESGDRARVHFELGSRAAEDNLWTEAVDQYGAAVSLDPGRAHYHARYGEALVRVGRPEEGLAAYREALARTPSNADFLFSAGVLAGQTGDHAGAAEFLERYVRFRPDEPRGHVELAVELVELGRLPEALAHLDRCPALFGDAGEDDWLERYHIAVGRYSEARGEPDLAVQAYEAALQVNPVSDEARRRLAALR